MVSGGEIDWVVITLKRTPERLQQFIANNAHQNLSVEPLEAVDGLLLDRDELVRTGLMAPDLDWKDGALGAALSHRLCWQRAVASGRPIGIFEDDVYLRGDFVQAAADVIGQLPEDWDLVHFGVNTDSILEVEVVPGCQAYGDFDRWYPSEADRDRFVQSRASVAPVKLVASFGTCAYAVSPKGAQRLLDYCFPLSFKYRYMSAYGTVNRSQTGDAIMNNHYSDMGAYMCLPSIALVLNDKTFSTVKA